VAREHVDAIAFAQLADSVHEPLDDGRLPLLQLGQVDFDGSGLDAAFPRALDRMNQVPGVDERLARNASVVQAFAAEPVPFHEEDALPQLRRSDGGRITAGPRTDDDEVDVPVHGPTERLRSLNPFANRGILGEPALGERT